MKEILTTSMKTIDDLNPIKKLEDQRSLRKMAQHIQQKIGARFPIQTTGKAIGYIGREFVEISNNINSCLVSLSSVGESAIRPGQSVQLISGTCLFGATGLKGLDQNKFESNLADPLAHDPVTPIAELSQMPTMHPSEAESALRLTQAIAILTGTAAPAEVKDRLNFHLPIPEYLLYLLDLKDKEVLTPELAMAGAELVMARARTVVGLFVKRLPPTLEVNITSPLNSIIKPLLEARFELKLENLTKFLSDQDGLWNQLLQTFPPASFDELNYLSYDCLYHQVQAQAQTAGQGCLAVEESKEGKILTEVKKQSQVLNTTLQMNVLYLAPKLVTTNGFHGKNELFMHDTAKDSLLRQLKTVVNIYKGGL